MNNFLASVLARKKVEVARRKNLTPTIVPPSTDGDIPRDFQAALAGGRVIAEIKRRSPSVPAFRNGANPAALARIYRDAGAAAISIVTDTLAFGMSLEDVQPVREASGLPVLVKDFITDAYQIREARAAGADAVLLIARIVDDRTLEYLQTVAESLDLATLVECHDRQDLASAARIGAKVVGINNRDLSTLEISLDTTRKLLDHVPTGALLVCESGIDNTDTIIELRHLGVDAFLVGGALLSAEDPGTRLKQMTTAARGQSKEGTDHE